MCIDRELFLPSPYIDHVLCPIGKQVLNDPVQIFCECAVHTYCKECIVNWMLTDPQRKCPICKKSVNFDYDKLPKEVVLSNLIGELEMKCENVIHNCDWVGKKKDLEQHLKECKFQEVACPNRGCKMRLLRNDINDHNKECDFYKVKCDFCDKKVKRIKLDTHVKDKCSMSKTVCEYCKVEFLKKDIPQHIVNECIYAEIVCPNENCYETFTRMNLDDHKKMCQYELIKCIQCNQEMIKKNMEKHLSAKCPNMIINCEHCKEQFMKKNINQHIEICPEKEIECEFKNLSGCNVTYKLKDKWDHDMKYFKAHTMCALSTMGKVFEKRLSIPHRIDMDQEIKLDCDGGEVTFMFNTYRFCMELIKFVEDDTVGIEITVDTNDDIKVYLTCEIGQHIINFEGLQIKSTPMMLDLKQSDIQTMKRVNPTFFDAEGNLIIKIKQLRIMRMGDPITNITYKKKRIT